MILPMSYYYMQKEDPYWERPDEFRPERFLNEEGKFVPPKKNFMPFGIGKEHTIFSQTLNLNKRYYTGKRQCLGEALARVELSIFTAALVQNFSFKPSPGKKVNIKPLLSFLFHIPDENQNILMENQN